MPDAFQSLYRRYRPQRFAEVRGQDHVVLALRGAVERAQVAHAYLFSGPRGTGKTSTARILAKALNCAAPVEGEPCGVCDSCVDITRGASFDVHELDAASNNGVEAMRDLVARASLATPGRWKVYIVDEVHMLSTPASNALLKTLEDPPAHVVFVLATTDPQKVLPTIRSRTQHYEFHLLDVHVLSSLLSEVARNADLELPDTAVEVAVRRGRGSARDALSALDQVAASGVVDDDSPFLDELLVALSTRDSARALRAVEDAMVAGHDAPRLAGELVDELRLHFLQSVAPGLGAEATRAVDPPLGTARSVRAMEVLGAAAVQMRDALDPRVSLDVALLRLTHPEVDDDPGALTERLDRLERRVVELSSQVAALPLAPEAAPPAPPPPPQAGRREAGAPSPPTEAPVSSSPNGPQAPSSSSPNGPPDPDAPSRDELVTAWGDHVLSQLRPGVRAVYAAGRFVGADGGAATFALPNQPHVERARLLEGEVCAALSAHFGRPVRLALVAEPGAPAGSAGPARGSSSSSGPGAQQGMPSSGGSRGGQGRPSSGGSSLITEAFDPASPEVASDPVSWAKDRLEQVFPGVEEV